MRLKNNAVCNKAQIVCDESGNIQVLSYDFLVPYFKRIEGIKKYHLFQFLSAHPSVVVVKQHADTTKIPMTIIRSSWKPNSSELPIQLEPKGLSAERQWYLYDMIRQFCSDDANCPLPTVRKQISLLFWYSYLEYKSCQPIVEVITLELLNRLSNISIGRPSYSQTKHSRDLHNILCLGVSLVQ